nr:MAG TPA: hypothetical protein [Caudoviricetes sp.]
MLPSFRTYILFLLILYHKDLKKSTKYGIIN